MCRPGNSMASATHDHDPAVKANKKDQKLPSGFERRKNLVQLGLVALSAIYGCVYYLNPKIIPVSDSYCEQLEEGEECQRPDLLAYKVTSLVAMTTMGLMGFCNWHFNAQVRQFASSKATAEDRLFGYLPAADYQNVVILCYQIWDFVISWTIPEHIDPIFLIHHVLAMITAYCSLEYQMVPYYSIFYGGCSEFSSIFLIFIDKAGMFVVQEGSLLDTWVLVCKGMFFLTFSYYRIFGWIYNSVPLWRDCRKVLESGAVEQHRPGKAFFLRLFLGLDVVLGALQCYWYSEILKVVVATAN